ncbi:PaaX family transcriptional regulator [Leucobacter luti]|uniref:PaaX family transcriptional regulator n=1 Tax=Leucobacter luti TaxID=340320 RepID=UPI001051EB0F|nr:PaaX family transcriptional regulator C-terminal domain-containing protein [Leucobacter luti]MCW2289768.1 phenylacetic acid degradation operon negative regulatory protein [Leucobacter luti]TCK34304.1 PaaX family transcriptional regulator [Leucobacter luti]
MRVLDDLDSRPGSANSLLRTVIGAVMREHGGWLPTRVCIELMSAVGLAPALTRTALTRVKRKGLVASERRGSRAGYALTPDAWELLARGDRRIHHPRSMTLGDHWCLVSFSIPEAERGARYHLRTRFAWIGAGHVSQSLWILPAYLRPDVEHIVADLGVTGHVTIFTVSEIDQLAVPPDVALTQWWDLPALRQLHEDFLAAHTQALDVTDPARAFGVWIRALDAWRPIPYRDPGLPPELLPADWPGVASSELFLALREATAEGASVFVRAVVADEVPVSAPSTSTARPARTARTPRTARSALREDGAL